MTGSRMAAGTGAEIVSVEVAEPAPGFTDACDNAQDGSGAGPVTAQVSWTVPPKAPFIPAIVMTSVWGVPDCTDRLVDAGASEKSSAAKVAVTEAAEFSVTSQLPVPEHAPLQPLNSDVASGVAASVTVVPGANACEQDLEQFRTPD